MRQQRKTGAALAVLALWAAALGASRAEEGGVLPDERDRRALLARFRAHRRDTSSHLAAHPDEPFSRYAAYFHEYYEALGSGAGRPVPEAGLLEEISGKRVVFLGDSHLCPGCRQGHRKILAGLALRRKVVLGLECVPFQQRGLLDDYLAGRAEFDALARGLARFWPHLGHAEAGWRGFFAFLRERGFRVEPLEDSRLDAGALLLEGRTQERDAAAAARIRSLISALEPDEVLAVVYGFYHLLGPGHLAARVDAAKAVLTPHAPAQRLGHLLAGGRPDATALRLGPGLYVVPWRPEESLGQDVDGCGLEAQQEAFRGLQFVRMRQALAGTPRARARRIAALIRRLADPSARAREEALAELRRITGRDFGPSAEAWRRWFGGQGGARPRGGGR